MEVMLPPTRSLASVTRKLPTLSLYLDASAWAVTRPEMPPPTITTS
jgi:hypothetical protein